MTNENQLIQKLMISKQIMDKHKQMPRANNGGMLPTGFQNPEVEEFSVPQAKYNLPEEFLQESKQIVKQPSEMTHERILSSKLPDEIKRLMIEHPIAQPTSNAGPTLSNELVEKASRLMGTNAAGQQVNKTTNVQKTNIGIDAQTIKSIIRETVEEVLAENGLLTESTQKSNETFQFRVGKHIFEGKVTKIKKVQ